MDAAFWIGFVSLVVVIALLVKRWTGEPGRTLIRYQMIDMLWNERERIRGTLKTVPMQPWERAQFLIRLSQIEDDLIRLGVPKESL